MLHTAYRRCTANLNKTLLPTSPALVRSGNPIALISGKTATTRFPLTLFPKVPLLMAMPAFCILLLAQTVVILEVVLLLFGFIPVLLNYMSE